MNTTKFSSPKFDTPSSTNDFPKFAHISTKKNKRKPKLTVTDSWDLEVNGPHSSVKERQGTTVDRR